MENKIKHFSPRRDLKAFLYATIRLLHERGWGRNEALNILLFTPPIIFTLWCALSEVISSGWQFWVKLIGFLYLVFGFFLLIFCSRRAYLLSWEKLKLKVYVMLLYLGVSFIWNICLISFILFFDITNDQSANPLAYTSSFITIYVVFFWVFYRYVSADRVEWILAMFEILLLFTPFIIVTGGCESRFFYLYFLSLVPAYYRSLSRSGMPVNGPHEAGSKLTRFLRGVREAIKNRSLTQKVTRLSGFLWSWLANWWNTSLSMPFLVLCGAFVWGAQLCVTHHVGGICPQGSLYHNIYLFFVRSAPSGLLLPMMVILMEIERDSLSALDKLMRDKVMKEWPETLYEVTAELAIATRRSFELQCSGILLMEVSHSLEKVGHYETKEAFQIEDIQYIPQDIILSEGSATQEILYIANDPKKPIAEERQVLLESEYRKLRDDIDPRTFPLVKKTEKPSELPKDIMSHLEGLRKVRTDNFSRFYYSSSNDRTGELADLVAEFNSPERGSPINEALASGSFWENVESLCYVVVPPSTEKNGVNKESDRSYSLIFFKSAFQGEFDDVAAELLTALSSQIVGIYRKSEKYQKRAGAEVEAKTRAIEAQLRSGVAMGTFHNLNQYLSRISLSLGLAKRHLSSVSVGLGPGAEIIKRTEDATNRALQSLQDLNEYGEFSYYAVRGDKEKILSREQESPLRSVIEWAIEGAAAHFVETCFLEQGYLLGIVEGGTLRAEQKEKITERKKEFEEYLRNRNFNAFFDSLKVDFHFDPAQFPENKVPKQVFRMIFTELILNALKRLPGAVRERDRLFLEISWNAAEGAMEIKNSVPLSMIGQEPPDFRKPPTGNAGAGMYGTYCLLKSLGFEWQQPEIKSDPPMWVQPLQLLEVKKGEAFNGR